MEPMTAGCAVKVGPPNTELPLHCGDLALIRSPAGKSPLATRTLGLCLFEHVGEESLNCRLHAGGEKLRARLLKMVAQFNKPWRVFALEKRSESLEPLVQSIMGHRLKLLPRQTELQLCTDGCHTSTPPFQDSHTGKKRKCPVATIVHGAISKDFSRTTYHGLVSCFGTNRVCSHW